VPMRGGVALDLSFFNQVLEINAAEKWVRVQGGARWNFISDELKKQGLALRTYPSSWFSTVGGWVNTGGSGIGTLKYGLLKDNVLELTLVTPQGEVRALANQVLLFGAVFNSEGQLGVVAEVKVKVRETPAAVMPHLYTFKSVAAAMAFARAVVANTKPFYLVLFDAPKMCENNRLMKKAKLPESPSILCVVESREEESALKRLVEGDQAAQEEVSYLAEYLWNERYFPIKAKKLGPGMLAADILMPFEKVAEYAVRAEALGHQFGVEVATEAHISSEDTALTLPTFLTDPRKPFAYLLHSAFASILAAEGIRLGGKPYGIGIWYKSFKKYKYDPAQWHRLIELKKRLDPKGLFNPGKSLSNGFTPPTVPGFAVPLMAWATRVFARAPAHQNEHAEPYREPDPFIHSVNACSACGACFAKCPAYLTTRDERTTARGKLQLGAEILMKGNGAITADEAQTMFLCMHCGYCTEVCQSELPLEDAWVKLEAMLEQKFGMPAERIAQFVKDVEAYGVMTETRP
ncbi:MAG: FAD-binding protein, partial [bacterium]